MLTWAVLAGVIIWLAAAPLTYRLCRRLTTWIITRTELKDLKNL